MSGSSEIGLSEPSSLHLIEAFWDEQQFLIHLFINHVFVGPFSVTLADIVSDQCVYFLLLILSWWQAFNMTPPCMSVLICVCIDQPPRGIDYRRGYVAHSPRFRKSNTLCIVYFMLEAWSSSLRTRICFLLKTVSQSIKYTIYTPTCNLTWGHKAESMRDNWANVLGQGTWCCVHG